MQFIGVFLLAIFLGTLVCCFGAAIGAPFLMVGWNWGVGALTRVPEMTYSAAFWLCLGILEIGTLLRVSVSHKSE